MIKSENWDNSFDFYGWQDEFEFRIKPDMYLYKEVVEWLYDNIHNTESNVCWTFTYGPVFRFRKAKDQAWFMLRWS